MSYYENYYIREQRLHGRNDDYYKHPEKYYVPPFRIAGNIYYIGDAKVCSHLIDTGDGLLIIDTGYPQAKALILQNIWEAGFSPKDVKLILHTHNHLDHFGCTNMIRGLSGCRTAMSRIDAENMIKKPELMMLGDLQYYEGLLFQPDILMEDGDEIELGNTKIRAVLTPGHTEGTMSFFWDVTEHGRNYRCGTFGGAGLITLYEEYFLRMGLPLTMRDEFKKSIAKLKKEPVDLVIGNHPQPNHIFEKREKQLENPDGQNPFIDPEDWITYLNWVDGEYEEFLKDGH